MAALVLVGAQWGDEGKGKITDFAASRADMVVRSMGGNNAGHTVEADGVSYKLHLIPSGILYPEKQNVLGNGMVIDPIALVGEMDYLLGQGISVDNLYVSDRAHLVFSYHRELDGLCEEARGEEDIGTTRKGIGPAYMDKMERIGIRVCDMADAEEFAALIRRNVAVKNALLTKLYGRTPVDAEALVDEALSARERILPHVTDASVMINGAIRTGKKVLFEGAQGTLLDIDLGTYPYVTSSYPTAGGVTIGSGVGPTAIDRVMGVAKAYTTRVGKGPFPTELFDETGQAIRDKGHEYGTTTGRPRRCGWLDGVILRYAVRVNGITGLALTRLDTLGGFDAVKVCTAYEKGGRRITDFPARLADLAQCAPVYTELPGWSSEISHIRDYSDLPAEARRYVSFIEEMTGVPVDMVSVGAGREETILRRDLF
jgi:adenylosuccinate synthase